jgi:hypothetical protein
MTAYFGCVEDNKALEDPKGPAHVFDALRTWKHEKLSSVTAQNPENPYAQCTKRAFVMCGTTEELKKALLGEDEKYFIDPNDFVCVKYVRIDALTHLKTREKVSVVCVAPLMSWWDVAIDPAVLKKYETECDLSGWGQYVSQAGHQPGWDPLFPLPKKCINSYWLANEVVPRGHSIKAWFEEGDNVRHGVKGVVRIGNERGPLLPNPSHLP